MTATMTNTEIQLDRRALVAALNRVKGAMPTRSNKTILECVRLQASGAVLHLSATDMDVAATTTVNCEGELSACVVRFRDILPRIKSSKAASCSLRFDEDRNVLVVNGGRVEHFVQTMAIEEFPIVVSRRAEQSIQIPSNTLQHALKICVTVSAREPSRYAINGVLLESDTEGTRCVATDGRRMGLVDLDGSVNEYEGSAILPLRFASLVAKFIDPKRDGNIDIFVDEEQAPDDEKSKPATIYACGSDWMLTSQSVEGNFPSHRDVIPPAGSKFVVSRTELTSLASEVSIAADSLNTSVLLRFAATSLGVSTSAPGCGESSGAIDAVFEGGGDEAIVVGVNPAYLLDAIKSLKSDEVVFDVRQNTLCQRTNSVRSSPLCLRERGSDSVTHVVMPVNLGLPPSLETLGRNCASLTT